MLVCSRCHRAGITSKIPLQFLLGQPGLCKVRNSEDDVEFATQELGSACRVVCTSLFDNQRNNRTMHQQIHRILHAHDQGHGIALLNLGDSLTCDQRTRRDQVL